MPRERPGRRLIPVYMRSLFWAVVCALGAYAVADESVLVLVLGVAGVTFGWWRAKLDAPLIPRPLFNALTALVIAVAVLYTLQRGLSVETFAFFTMLLLVLRCADLREPRDHAQVLILTIGFVVAAALTSSTLMTGIFVIGSTLLCARTVLLYSLFSTSRSIHNPPDSLAQRGAADLRAIQLVIGFCCVTLAIAIFVVMPRNLGSSTLGRWGSPSGGLTAGFSPEVELGRPGRISSSPTPVMRISVRDRDDRSLGASETPPIYLRGSILTRYESGRWLLAQRGRAGTRINAIVAREGISTPVIPDAQDPAWSLEYVVMLEPGANEDGYLFAPWMPTEIRVLDRDAQLSVHEDTRRIKAMGRVPDSYRVRTRDLRLEHPIVLPGFPRGEADPGGVPERISELARTVLVDASVDPDPATRAIGADPRAVRALENHLRSSYGYSLESVPVPPGRDATEWFMFDRRAGHCEYFASALALMCRSVGIPARVVTGYVTTEFNEVTGAYVVRQSNAHAWVEAQAAPGQWRVYDGTPQSDFSQIHRRERTAFGAIGKLYDAIQHAWVTAVVGYDSDTQGAVLGDIDTDLGLEELSSNLQSRYAAGRSRLVKQALIWGLAAFIGSMTLGLGLLFVQRLGAVRRWWGRIRLRVRRLGADAEEAAAIQLAASIDLSLDRLGTPRDPADPIRSHIRTLRSGSPEGSDVQRLGQIERGVMLLYRSRFGFPDERPDPAELVRMAQMIRSSA